MTKKESTYCGQRLYHSPFLYTSISYLRLDCPTIHKDDFVATLALIIPDFCEICQIQSHTMDLYASGRVGIEVYHITNFHVLIRSLLEWQHGTSSLALLSSCSGSSSVHPAVWHTDGVSGLNVCVCGCETESGREWDCVCMGSILWLRNGFSVSNVCPKESCRKDALDVH